jgi:integrase
MPSSSSNPRMPAVPASAAASRREVEAFTALAISSSLAPSSRKNYDSHVRLYAAFCRLMLLPPFPPSLDTLSRYLAGYVQRGNSPHCAPGILSCLKRHCLERGIAWLSFEDSRRLGYLRQGLFRLAPKGEPKRAAACTLAVLRKVIEALDARHPLGMLPATPRELMVLTMCVLAHNTLLRTGELLALKRKHLKWVSATEITVIIESSKCNQTGLPEEIICQDYGGLSFVPFMFAYDAANQVRQQDPEGPLFPRDPRVTGSPALSKGLFIATFRSLLRMADLPAASFSGHSFRAGGATDLFHGACRPHMLQQQGRWRSDTFWTYVRDNPTLRCEEVSQAFARMS